MKIIFEENGKTIDHFTVTDDIIDGVGSEIEIIRQMWEGSEVQTSANVGDYLFIKPINCTDFEKFNVKIAAIDP